VDFKPTKTTVWLRGRR